MRSKLLNAIVILFIIIVVPAFDHPLKLTSSLIEYSSEEKSMKIECRVFIDDFENTINRKDWDVNNLTKEDIAEIEFYFSEYYRITYNSKLIPLKYSSSIVYGGNNVISLKFSLDDLEIKKGDHMFIENKLFFKEFGYLQSNQMTVRIPPFVPEDYFEANDKKYLVHYKFQ